MPKSLKPGSDVENIIELPSWKCFSASFQLAEEITVRRLPLCPMILVMVHDRVMNG